MDLAELLTVETSVLRTLCLTVNSDSSPLKARIADTLAEIQDNLFQSALRRRDEQTRDIDSLEEFQDFFTPKAKEKPEIHGGLARCHWAEDAKTHEILGKLKVTIRCVPIDAPSEPGKCIFTGQESQKRAVFAKAY